MYNSEHSKCHLVVCTFVQPSLSVFECSCYQSPFLPMLEVFIFYLFFAVQCYSGFFLLNLMCFTRLKFQFLTLVYLIHETAIQYCCLYLWIYVSVFFLYYMLIQQLISSYSFHWIYQNISECNCWGELKNVGDINLFKECTQLQSNSINNI